MTTLIKETGYMMEHDTMTGEQSLEGVTGEWRKADAIDLLGMVTHGELDAEMLSSDYELLSDTTSHDGSRTLVWQCAVHVKHTIVATFAG
ncbi:hypothetical protein VP2p47 [Vibrio phage VP2]|uniref:hypothetical protein n=1 Tax=Vibrio phage VP2 TaxID=260372 RepID=UPI00003CEC47|nr:hypothetical protein VP2p47 [Vibrio phage VP2]